MSRDLYFDRTLRGWIHNAAVKEHSSGRLSKWYEIEDLAQEGYICFCRCWEMYQPLFDVDEPSEPQRRHFMSLVQSAVLNRFKNMTKYAKYRRAVVYTDDWVDCGAGVADEVATLLLMLRQAPAEIKDVVNKLLSDFEPGPYRRRKIAPGSTSGFRLRETTREYWARMLGDPDIKDKLVHYFSS